MLEGYDPYLTNFLRDIGACISMVFQALELFLGVSYFTGRKVVEGVLWLLATTAHGYHGASEVGAVMRDEIVEFGSSFGRAVLLIFYAAHKIIDSFCITAVDLYNFHCHAVDSISRTIFQTTNFFADCVLSLFTDVPQQVVAALSMIGESTLNFCNNVFYVILDFLYQVLVSPVNAVVTFTRLVIIVPIRAASNMPPSSFLGLLVLLLCAFVCRGLIRYMLLRNIHAFSNSLVSLVCSLFTFIRLHRLKNLFSSSMLTIDNSDQVQKNSKVTCVICQDKPVTYMSTPCKHVCLCEVCVYDLLQHDSRCPICRSQVSKYDRVFIP